MSTIQIHSAHLYKPLLLFALLLSLFSCTPRAPTPTLAPPSPLPTPLPTSPPAPTPFPHLQSGTSQHSLTINGQNRSYILHIPPAADSLHPLPLVFAFHGFSGNPANMASTSQLNELSDQANFLVIFPAGTGTNENDASWNAGAPCCGIAVEKNIDDVAFVRQILADVKTIVPIDSKRIFATGMSNGAMFSYRLGCEMSDTFAAIAPVAGVLEYSACQPQEPVSLIHIHGMADPLVPFRGQNYSGPLTYPEYSPRVLFQPITQSIATWSQFDGCSGAPQITREHHNVTHTLYASCRSNTQVELYAIDDVGHTWTSDPVFPTTQTIWNFFVAHPKP